MSWSGDLDRSIIYQYHVNTAPLSSLAFYHIIKREGIVSKQLKFKPDTNREIYTSCQSAEANGIVTVQFFIETITTDVFAF